MQTPGTPSDGGTRMDHDADRSHPAKEREMPTIREGIDAEDDERLKADPSDADAKLDVGLDDTFPTSDPPATTQPGADGPAPSTGFDEDAERRLAEKRTD